MRQRETIEWVPVGERLPTEQNTANNQILVTFGTGCVAAVPLRMAIMAGKRRDITAWAPLPAPCHPNAERGDTHENRNG